MCCHINFYHFVLLKYIRFVENPALSQKIFYPWKRFAERKIFYPGLPPTDLDKDSGVIQLSKNVYRGWNKLLYNCSNQSVRSTILHEYFFLMVPITSSRREPIYYSFFKKGVGVYTLRLK